MKGIQQSLIFHLLWANRLIHNGGLPFNTRHGRSSHHPNPPSPSPLADPTRPAALLPISHLNPLPLSCQPPTPLLIPHVFTQQIPHPPLTFNTDLHALHHPFFYPLPTVQVQHPLLVAPLPAPRCSDILKIGCALRPISGDALRGQRIIRRRTEDPGFPFPVYPALPALQLEDLHFPRLGRGIEDDVLRDPAIEPALHCALMWF